MPVGTGHEGLDYRRVVCSGNATDRGLEPLRPTAPTCTVCVFSPHRAGCVKRPLGSGGAVSVATVATVVSAVCVLSVATYRF